MRPPEEVKQELVRQWILKAEEDLGAAEVLSKHETSFLSVIGFHAQQASEKYLKAFLTFHQIEFPKTHDLMVLLDIVEKIDGSLAEILADLVSLNAFGVELRYPGDLPAVEVDEAKKAVELARITRDCILERLSDVCSRL